MQQKKTFLRLPPFFVTVLQGGYHHVWHYYYQPLIWNFSFFLPWFVTFLSLLITSQITSQSFPKHMEPTQYPKPGGHWTNSDVGQEGGNLEGGTGHLQEAAFRRGHLCMVWSLLPSPIWSLSEPLWDFRGGRVGRATLRPNVRQKGRWVQGVGGQPFLNSEQSGWSISGPKNSASRIGKNATLGTFWEKFWQKCQIKCGVKCWKGNWRFQVIPEAPQGRSGPPRQWGGGV